MSVSEKILEIFAELNAASIIHVSTSRPVPIERNADLVTHSHTCISRKRQTPTCTTKEKNCQSRDCHRVAYLCYAQAYQQKP